MNEIYNDVLLLGLTFWAHFRRAYYDCLPSSSCFHFSSHNYDNSAPVLLIYL